MVFFNFFVYVPRCMKIKSMFLFFDQINFSLNFKAYGWTSYVRKRAQLATLHEGGRLFFKCKNG